MSKKGKEEEKKGFLSFSPWFGRAVFGDERRAGRREGGVRVLAIRHPSSN